jgi:hypothetical protein
MMGVPNRQGQFLIPSLRDGSPFAEFAGTSYLATFILSLRDKSLVAIQFRLVTPGAGCR